MAKRCPVCQSTHPDSLGFCPSDGAALVALADTGGESAGPLPQPQMAAVASGVSEPAERQEATMFYAAVDLRASAPPPARGGGASTYADALKRAPMPAAVAVARMAVLADAVHEQRQGRHGALSPAHLCFASHDASGEVHVAASDAVSDPMVLAPYRAPELDSGAAAGPAAEVYALGCMLFHAVTGRPPYEGTDAATLAQRHAAAATPAIRLVRRDADVPPAVEVELQRALRKRPADRHASAAAFAGALRAASRDDDRGTVVWAAGAVAPVAVPPRHAVVPPPPAAPAPVVSPAEEAAANPDKAATQHDRSTAVASQPVMAGGSSRRGAAVAVAVLAALATVGAVLLWPRTPPAPPPQAVAAEPPAAVPDAGPPDTGVPDASAADVDDADGDDADAADAVDAIADAAPAKPAKAASKPKGKSAPASKSGSSEKKGDVPAVF